VRVLLLTSLPSGRLAKVKVRAISRRHARQSLLPTVADRYTVSVTASCLPALPAKRQAARANAPLPTTNLRAERSAGRSSIQPARQRSPLTPLASYVAALELRIEKLERRLQYAKSRKASVALHDPDASIASEVDRRDSLATIRAAIHRKAAKHRENHDVNSIVSDFGSLCVSHGCQAAT